MRCTERQESKKTGKELASDGQEKKMFYILYPCRGELVLAIGLKINKTFATLHCHPFLKISIFFFLWETDAKVSSSFLRDIYPLAHLLISMATYTFAFIKYLLGGSRKTCCRSS